MSKYSPYFLKTRYNFEMLYHAATIRGQLELEGAVYTLYQIRACAHDCQCPHTRTYVRTYIMHFELSHPFTMGHNFVGFIGTNPLKRVA